MVFAMTYATMSLANATALTRCREKSVAGEGAHADTVRAIATRPLEVRPMLVVRTWVLPSLSRSGD